jgi:DNA-directed RNA polymerase specialized sigma24 family protein
MSAALQLPSWEGTLQAAWQIEAFRRVPEPVEAAPDVEEKPKRLPRPAANLAVFRRPTEKLLRRYLYASMQVGRSPSILSDPVARGWASSHPVHTFEDALIFVLDIETCLSQIPLIDREILSKVVLQEYTHAESAVLMGMCARHMTNRFGVSLDRLSEKLLEAGLLVIPHS